MKSTIHAQQKNNFILVSKNQIKKIGLLALLALSFASCTPNDPTGNPTGGNPTAEFLSIKSTNLPTGNSCNVWDLQSSTIAAPFTYSTLRVGDNIVSSAVYLGQTTMNNQTSAWDKVNKRYAVSIGESLIVYNYSGVAFGAPVVYPIGTNKIACIEAVNGFFYVLRKDMQLQVESGGVFTLLTTLPLPANTYVSNMAFDGNDIYFISNMNLYRYNVVSAVLNTYPITSGVSTTYDGVEFYGGKIYAAKRISYTHDDFVSLTISGATAAETTLPTTLAYVRDYSRIASALDYNTGTYFMVSSNGHSSDLHTMTKIDLSGSFPATANPTLNNYVFGLQLRD